MNKRFFSVDICLRRSSSVAFKPYFSSNKSIITLNPRVFYMFFLVIHTTFSLSEPEYQTKKKLSGEMTNVELNVLIFLC